MAREVLIRVCCMTATSQANLVPRTVPLVFNIRMDPYESYDTKDSYGHLMQDVSWLLGPIGEQTQGHLQTLAQSPPV